MTYLEQVRDRLGEERSAYPVLVVMPLMVLEAIRGVYHRQYYELAKIGEDRDVIEALLDAGGAGMADPLLMSDLIARLDTLNGHVEQLQQAMYTTEDVAIADVVAGMAGDGTNWTLEDIANALSYLSAMAAAL